MVISSCIFREIGVQRSLYAYIEWEKQPSFDFLARTIARFPDLNSEWLLTGNGSMIKPNEPGRKNIRPVQQELFTDSDIMGSNDIKKTEANLKWKKRK